MRMKITRIAISSAILLGGLNASAANAGVILNDVSGFGLAVSFFDPVGQSFTAIDAELMSIGLRYSLTNSNPSTEMLTLNVRDGAGLGGAILASKSFFLPNNIPVGLGFGEFFDVDFVGTTLTVGQVYTFELTTNTSGRSRINWGRNTYAGGRMYESDPGTLFDCGNGSELCDLNFRIVGRTAAPAIPEPASWALMIAGFGLTGAAARARRRGMAACHA